MCANENLDGEAQLNRVPKKFIFKIVVAGEGGVGKTTLLQRFVEGIFNEETKLTVGIGFFAKELDLGPNHFTLQLWDFGGQERFRFMQDSYILGAKGALLMFDLTRMTSLENLATWVDLLRKYDPNIPLLLIGTKLDLTDEICVKDSYSAEMKDEFKCLDFIKVSSKTGENVRETFEKITYAIMRNK